LNAELQKLTPAAPAEEKPDWVAGSRFLESLPQPADFWESLVIIFQHGRIENKDVRKYVQAAATHKLQSNKTRLSLWPVGDGSGSDADVWPQVVTATCGEVLPADEVPANWTTRLNSIACRAVSFDAPEIPSGFFLYDASLISGSSQVRNLSGILLGPSSTLPPVQQFVEMQNNFESARAGYNAKDGDVARAALQQVLLVNPMNTLALRFASDMYKTQRDWATSFRLLEPLSVTSPTDGDLFRELGDLQFELKNWAESEKYYQRSLQRKGEQLQTLKNLSIIREQLGDLSGAAGHLEKVIEMSPTQLDLFLRHAGLRDRLNQPSAAAISLESALELDPKLDDVRIRLVGIHSAAGNSKRVSELIKARIPDIPNDLSLRMRYAEEAEKLHLPEEALTLYTLALESDATHEPAHFASARLLLSADRKSEAYGAVVAGLEADQRSMRLHLMKIELLQASDRVFEVREATREAVELFPDAEVVLGHWARQNDIFGNRGGETQERWILAMERAGLAADEITRAVERGLTVALRDGEHDVAMRLSQKLGRSAAATSVASFNLIVPGGIRGLAQTANIDADVSSARFIAEYGRAILRGSSGQESDKFKNRIRAYMKTVQDLKAFGRVTNGVVEIEVDLKTDASVDRAEKILQLFGWRIRRSRNTFQVELRSDEDAADRQTYGSALGIDEVQMKTLLEQKQAFTFRVADDRVPMIFDEPYWFGSILKEQRPKRSFLDEMIENPAITRLYLGLASMSDETQRAIVQAVEPDQLIKRSARLAFYGSSIAIENGRVELPGGAQAAAAWSRIVDANPERTAQFIGNLIRKDDGKLLAYYYSIAVLPPDHQRFFTRTPQRLTAFYRVFPFEDERSLENNFFWAKR